MATVNTGTRKTLPWARFGTRRQSRVPFLNRARLRERNATPPQEFHWEGDDATGKCVPNTPPPDPESDKDKCNKLPDHHWDDATGTCVEDTEEYKCNKRKLAGDPVEWDAISGACKSTKPTPSGGGGGGGGGGVLKWSRPLHRNPRSPRSLRTTMRPP
jgi:hypothetical protein